MAFNYEKHCRKKIRYYARKNRVHELYSFLLNNLDFVLNTKEVFRKTSISKAHELLLACDEGINNSDSNEFITKCINIRNVLIQYLSHFD